MFSFVFNFIILQIFINFYSINCQNSENLISENACCGALVNRQHLKVFTPESGPNLNRHYQYHSASPTKCLSFRIRADKDAHIALVNRPKSEEPWIEIVISGWGGFKSVIRRKGIDYSEIYNIAPLDANDDLGFWITWNRGRIRVGKEGDTTPFMTWNDPQPFDVKYFGFSTCCGSSGKWIIQEPNCPSETIRRPEPILYRG